MTLVADPYQPLKLALRTAYDRISLSMMLCEIMPKATKLEIQPDLYTLILNDVLDSEKDLSELEKKLKIETGEPSTQNLCEIISRAMKPEAQEILYDWVGQSNLDDWTVDQVLHWMEKAKRIRDFIEAARNYKPQDLELTEACNAVIQELDMLTQTKPDIEKPNVANPEDEKSEFEAVEEIDVEEKAKDDVSKNLLEKIVPDFIEAARDFKPQDLKLKKACYALIEFAKAVHDFKPQDQELKEACITVISEIERLTAPTIQPQLVSHGYKTKELIEKILTAGNPNIGFVDSQNIQYGNGDMQIEVKLGQFKTLLRCIDNPTDEPEGSKDDPKERAKYLSQYVEHAEYLTYSKKYDAVILLTHDSTGTNNNTKSKVEIVSVPEFIGRYFKLDQRKQRLKDQLKHHKLVDADMAQVVSIEDTKYLAPIPCKVWQGAKEKPENDCFEYMKKQLQAKDEQVQSKREAVTCVLLGHFGMGKTSLCLRLAYTLLEDTVQKKSQMIIPVFLSVKHIAYTDTDDALSEPRVTLDSIRNAIQQQFGYEISDKLIKNFFKEGKLIIFIDALDELPSLADPRKAVRFIEKLPNIGQGQAKYVITLRPELFKTREEEVKAFRFTRREESKHRALLIRMKNLNDNEAKDKLKKRIPTWNRLVDSDTSGGLEKLILTPLFHRIAKELDDEELDLTDYELVKAFVDRWAERETERQKATLYALEKDERLEYCKLLARAATENWNGKIPYNRLLDVIKRYNGTDMKDAEMGHDKFGQAVRLSMFLIRDDDDTNQQSGTNQKNTYRFLYPAVQQFFLSENIGDELLKEKPNVLSTVELNEEMKLIPSFLKGYFKNTSEKKKGYFKNKEFDPEKMLRDIAEGNSFIDRSSTNSLLIQNLLFLAFGLRNDPNEEAPTTPIWLGGLALPLVDLRRMPVSDEESLALDPGNANLEFVQFSQGEKQDKPDWTETPEILSPVVPEWHGYLAPQGKEELREYCDKYMIAEKKEIIEDELKKEILTSKEGTCKTEFSWVLVPGGGIPVGKHEAESQKPKTSTRVLLPSFLIQRHPVTNGQFLHFLRQHENRKWRPDIYRKIIGDNDYLAGWTPMLEDLSLYPDRWDESAIINKEKLWLNAPVVYVTWDAANAFARYYGLALPTEAEYEAAARLGHPPYDERDATLPENMWGITNLEGYAIYRGTPGLPKKLPLYPYWDCTVPNPASDKFNPVSGKIETTPLTPDFARWVKKKWLEDNLDVPFHLVGGVREWTQDVWHPDWPQRLGQESARQKFYMDRYNTGLRMDPETESMSSEEFRHDHRALRGGSYHLGMDKCKISYRDHHLRTNVDPNTGFRCVKRIWPSISQKPDASASIQTTETAMMTKRKHVFISYNHDDSMIANKLKNALQAHGIAITIDQGMRAGQDIHEFILESIKSTDVTLSVISVNSLLSAWVAVESMHTFFHEIFDENKLFIGCFIDPDFIEIDFLSKATGKIDAQIEKIEEEMRILAQKGQDTIHINSMKTRFYDLRHNLPKILNRLNKSLTLDIRHDKFDANVKKIINTIKA